MITPAVSRWSRLLLCWAALILYARPASADWQYAPFFGWEFAGHTSVIDLEGASDETHRALGVTVTQIGDGILGFEATALYVPGYFNDPKRSTLDDTVTGSHSYALMGNVVIAAPLKWNEYGLRPYLSGGFGLLALEQELTSSGKTFTEGLRFFGANVGGGAVGFLSNRTGLRFDMRFYTNVRNATKPGSVVGASSAHLRYWAGTIGLVLR